MRDRGQTEVLFYRREVLLSSSCSPILCREVLFFMLDSRNARTEMCMLRPLRLSFQASRIRSIAFVKESIVGAFLNAFSKRHLALFFFPIPFKHNSAHLSIYTKRNETKSWGIIANSENKRKEREKRRKKTRLFPAILEAESKSRHAHHHHHHYHQPSKTKRSNPPPLKHHPPPSQHPYPTPPPAPHHPHSPA